MASGYMPRRLVVWLGAALVSLIAAAWLAFAYFKPSSAPLAQQPIADVGDTSSQNVTAPNDGGGDDEQNADSRPPSVDRGVAGLDPFRGVPRTRRGLALEADPFVAESPAEQEWLDRHGYPNQMEWDALRRATLSELEVAAKRGDLMAEVWLAGKGVNAGDVDASQVLLDAGARGSTFALELLSGSIANRPQGRELSYALSRVVEMRGNSRIALGREALFSTPLSVEERLRAEALALRLHRSLQAQAQQIRGAPPPPDPRPFGG